jgi:2-aminoadipate transaminase
MSFAYPFSRTAEAMRPSPIRELFKLTQRRGMISFAGGLPDPIIFPVAEFASCAEALHEHGRVALQYGASEGYRPLVDSIAVRSRTLLGRPVAPEEVVITSGSQQAMDMLARVLIDPGDVIVVEAPTYPGALHTFRNCGARFLTVPCDDDGMLVDLLPDLLARCRRETGRAAKLIYSIVNFSNPSGACLAAERRRALAEVACRHRVPVLEDDPYGELRFRGDAIPSLYSLAAGEGVIYASSFSKILAPGVRVAWAIGDRELVRRMVIAKQGMDLCTSMVAQVLVAEYSARGFLDSHLVKIRAHYAGKAAAMAAELRGSLAGLPVHWSDPDGGFFFWLDLGNTNSETLFARAIEAGVAFLPGRAFFPETAETIGEAPDGRRFARLCFTFAQPEEIATGCRRLAAAFASVTSTDGGS